MDALSFLHEIAHVNEFMADRRLYTKMQVETSCLIGAVAQVAAAA